MSDTMKLQCELDHKTQELAEQAEQIEMLSDEINYLRGNEKGRKPSCLLYFDQKRENQQQAEQIRMLENNIAVSVESLVDYATENQRLKDDIASIRQTYDNRTIELSEQIQSMNRKFADCRELRVKYESENQRLKEFAKSVIRTECWCYQEQDGFELQELAERLGLIVEKIATEEDVTEESEYEVGDKIYVFSAALKEMP